MNLALLDTDTVSELLKQRDANVMANGAKYLHIRARFAFSAITRYEIRRGYLAKGAVKQLQDFKLFCVRATIFPVDDSVLDRAGELWSLAKQNGWPRTDADLIIGATALLQNRELVTGNSSHFSWMPGLTIVDWRQP